jgi:RNA polymerase sigma factor (sigma-70 family)
MAEYTRHSSAPQLGEAVLLHALSKRADDIEQALGYHEGLIHAVIRREWSGVLTYEEALQAGRIGLWRALLGYDVARGTAFSTYAWVAIRRHIHRAAVRAERDAREQVTVVPMIQAGYGTTEDGLHSWVEEVEASIDQVLVEQTLFALLSQLPDRLRQVVTARYGLDRHPPRSLRKLGAQLALSHERIRQLEQDALAWLRHPYHCLLLRQLLGKNTTTDYRQALACNAALRRKRRGRREQR